MKRIFSSTRQIPGWPLRLAALALAFAAVAVGCDRNVAASVSAAAVQPGVPVPPPVPRAEPVPLPAPEPAPEGLRVLALGDSADLAASTTLRFERVVSDSRCPAGVQCVWAGEVRIALVLASPAGSKEFELSKRDNKTTLQNFDIELVDYGPCPAYKAGPARECATLKANAVATQ
jgi:hypothetical protein